MKLVNKTIIVSFGQLSSTFMQLTLSVVLSRTLDQYSYGTFQQVWLYYSILLPAFSIGIPGSVLYFIPQNPEKKKVVSFQTFFILNIIGLLFGVATYLISPTLANLFNNTDLIYLFRIFFIYPMLAVPIKAINLILIAEDQPFKATGFSILTNLILTLSFILPSIISLPLRYTFISANIGAVVSYLIGIIYIINFYKNQSFNFDFKLLKEQIGYSIPLGLSTIVGTASAQLNKVIISSSLSPMDYAIYVNGAFEIPFIGILTGSIMTVLIPEFSRRIRIDKNDKEIWNIWRDATNKTSLLLFPIIVFFLISSKEIIIVFFSNKYVDSYQIFSIFILLSFVRITQYSALFQAIGKTKIILYSSLISLIINFILSWISIPILGMKGPAYANLLSTYLLAIIYLVLLCKYFNVKFSSIMPWKKLGTILVYSLIPALFTYPLFLTNLNTYIKIILAIFLYGLSYISILIIRKETSFNEIKTSLHQIMLSVRSNR